MSRVNLQRLALVLAATLSVSMSVSSALAKVTQRTLRTREAEVQAVIQRALPCTVAIESTKSGGSGSGVIVSKDGLILTAGHVTQVAGDDLWAQFPRRSPS